MLKKIVLLFTLISFALVNAQDTPAKADAEIRAIDTLIKYNEFAKAERNTKALYKKLNTAENSEAYTGQLLELKYREALIIDKEQKNPSDCLELLMGIVDEAEERKLHSLSCRIYLLIAVCQERGGQLSNADMYLKKALSIIRQNKLEKFYSTYCIRRSSYHRHMRNKDSLRHYALEGRKYAEKYGNEPDLMDSYLLLPEYNDTAEALKISNMLLKYNKKTRSPHIAMDYENIAYIYTYNYEDYPMALKYVDSAYLYMDKLPLSSRFNIPYRKSVTYRKMGRYDSAYHYYREYHKGQLLWLEEEQNFKTKELEEKYQSDKKEATIKNKNQQLFLIIILLTVTIGASFLLYRYNRKISRQNATINRQVMDLSRLLEQKQVLLSELQHRVKNNLQHVISILELQKESVGFNNIDELIRENQNRIHSMALLHRKLNVSDSINDIELGRYVTELSGLVVNSYERRGKEVSLNIQCGIETLSIEKALPLGLIIVELVSNSIKHAFKKQKSGSITITIHHDAGLSKNVLDYADNGPGYDFGKVSSKGLGMEIIKGLIDQLDGEVKTGNANGFELILSF